MSKWRKSLCLAAAFALGTTLILSGCDGKEQTSSGAPVEDVTFPLEEPVTLSMFCLEDGTDNEFFKIMEERTNVKIEFITPSNQETMATEYNLMIQSGGDLPDIIYHRYFGYPGGLDQAVTDNVYVDLTPYVDSIMTNFKAKLDKNPSARKVITTPDGRIAFCGWIRDPDIPSRPAYFGPIIRKDFLDQLQLPVPKTVDDWYTTLTAFKNQLKVKNPLVLSSPINPTLFLLSAYGTNDSIYVDDNGKVQMGLIQEGARQWVTEMNQWVKEGLLVINPNLSDKDYTSNENGAWIHGFYMLDIWKQAASSPDYRAVGTPLPVMKEGDILTLNSAVSNDPATAVDNGGYTITTSCENPAVAAKWLDYLYSEEGVILASYGVEGDTFTYDADHKPHYTDKILKGEGGYLATREKYFFKYSPAWDDWSELEGYTADEQDAITVQWANATNENGYPALYLVNNFMTDEERDKLDPPVYQYLQESVTKMITGELSLSYWDEMVQQAKVQGMDEQMDIYQRAYDKYMESIK